MEDTNSPSRPTFPGLGSLWKHKKGNLYRIVRIARDSDTLEHVVIYELAELTLLEVDPDRTWVRRLSEFMDGRFTQVDFHGGNSK